MSDDAIKTVVGEIMRIAVEHGYEGTQIKTITGAIDALADTLAGSDVDSGQTVAQAVRALAPYIGSGGGVSLGALQDMPVRAIQPISVDSALETLSIKELGVGTQQVGSNWVDSYYLLSGDFNNKLAAGLTVVSDILPIATGEVSAYACTGEVSDGDFVVEAFRVIDLDVDVDTSAHTMTFTMPDLNGERLCLYVPISIP